MTPDSSRPPLASGVRNLLVGAAALGAFVGVSLAAAAVLGFRPFPSGAHPGPPVASSRRGLGLRAEVRGGGLQVSWNQDAAAVRNATSGSLTFHDGETRKTLQLSQTAARAGSVFYAARGTQVQVAVTIFAPDHVVSESISATVPVAALQSVVSPAGESLYASAVPSGELEITAASPEANPLRTGETGAAVQHPSAGHTDRARQTVSAENGRAAGNSAIAANRREEPAISAPDVAGPDSTSNAPDTIAIRVEVDGTGKVVNAVMIPQQDVDPAFAEAALEMARDWRFEASPAGNERTIRILEFRQPASR